MDHDHINICKPIAKDRGVFPGVKRFISEVLSQGNGYVVTNEKNSHSAYPTSDVFKQILKRHYTDNWQSVIQKKFEDGSVLLAFLTSIEAMNSRLDDMTIEEMLDSHPKELRDFISSLTQRLANELCDPSDQQIRSIDELEDLQGPFNQTLSGWIKSFEHRPLIEAKSAEYWHGYCQIWKLLDQPTSSEFFTMNKMIKQVRNYNKTKSGRPLSQQLKDKKADGTAPTNAVA